MKAHKHTLGNEHEFEPQYGLPEVLPEGERLLWQGSPQWRSMALHAFHLRKLAIYFGVWLALRLVFDLNDGVPAMAIVKGQVGLALLAALALGLVAYMARLSATQAVYTITDKRVVMRIGIVLTVTFNLPLRQIESAGLHLHKDGTGDIPLTLAGGQRIAWLQLWPHARPWMLRKPQPMLRNIALPEHVAGVLAQAWQARTQGVVVATEVEAQTRPGGAAPETADAGAPPRVRPVLAGGRSA
jgi:hypothetical protein